MKMDLLRQELESLSKISLYDTDFLSKILPDFTNVEMDHWGNYSFKNGNQNSKTHIIIQCNSTGVLLGNQTENKCSISVLGAKKEEVLKHSVIFDQDKPIGVIRPKEKNNDSIYLETFSDFFHQDNRIYYPKERIICKDDSLYGFELNAIFSLYLWNSLIKNSLLSEKDIRFTLWNTSVSCENSIMELCRTENSANIIFISCVDSQDGCKAKAGPAFAIKDGNYITSKKSKEIVNHLGLPYQSFLGKTDGTLERLSVSCPSENLFGFYVPVLHAGTKMEQICYQDIIDIEKIVLKTIGML